MSKARSTNGSSLDTADPASSGIARRTAAMDRCPRRKRGGSTAHASPACRAERNTRLHAAAAIPYGPIRIPAKAIAKPAEITAAATFATNRLLDWRRAEKTSAYTPRRLATIDMRASSTVDSTCACGKPGTDQGTQSGAEAMRNAEGSPMNNVAP